LENWGEILMFADKDEFIENPIVEMLNGLKYSESKLKDKFIKEYTPFIAETVSRYIGTQVDPEESEEFRVGLGAFKEAIEQYTRNQSYSFVDFAEGLIKKRLLKYLRENRRTFEEYPFSHLRKNTM
jgi:RNA polymerase sigma factor